MAILANGPIRLFCKHLVKQSKPLHPPHAAPFFASSTMELAADWGIFNKGIGIAQQSVNRDSATLNSCHPTEHPLVFISGNENSVVIV
jgi:hypothetical protein